MNRNSFFISDDQEVGRFALSKDWSSHPMGEPGTWPQALLTTLSTIFNSRQPMFLFWGPENFCFYNDGYLPILGAHKHPWAMGCRGDEVWSEVWPMLMPQIDQVMINGKATWNVDQMVPINRDGGQKESYFTYSYSPIFLESGSVGGVIVVCTESTERISVVRALREREDQLNLALSSAQMGTWSIDLRSHLFTTSQEAKTILGVEDLDGNVYEMINDRMHPDDRDEVQLVLKDAIEQRKPYVHEYRIVLPDGSLRWIFSRGQAQSKDGRAPGFLSGIVMDITDRKRAQIEFERNVDVSPAILWITEKDGSCTYLSKQWYEFTGQTPEEALGFGWLNATHPGDKEKTAKTYTEANAQQVPFYSEYRLKTKSGEYRWAIDAGNPRYDQQGNYLGYAGTVFDIHDRIIAEQNELESQAQFKILANSIPQLAWMADQSGMVLWYNQRWYDYTGTSEEQREVESKGGSTHPDHLDRVAASWKKALQSGNAWEDTFPIRSKNESYRWFLSRAHPIRNTEGKIVQWFGTNTDIHDLREAQEKLTESESHLRLALTAGQMGIWTIRFPEGVITGDQQFIRMHGIKPENSIDDVGALIQRHAYPGDGEKIKTALEYAVATESPYICEYRCAVAENTYRWLYARGEVRYHADGSPDVITGISVDIEDRKRAEIELLTAKEEAERANQLKSAFLANMSHEIRTPLGVMMGFADLIVDPDLDLDEKRQFAQTLKRNGEQLSVLINDILDLSKVEAGHLKIEAIQFSLRNLIEESLLDLNVRAREKGLRLSSRIDASIEDQIVSDPTRLRQIIYNVVGNAIKFTQKGEVTLVAMQNGKFLEIEIHDTGVGIASEKQDLLFRPFSQADESMTRKFGGTGLGLALSKRLADLLGGDLTLKYSSPGSGSVFRIVVQSHLHGIAPIVPKRRDASKLESDTLTSLDSVSILLVEDSPDNQQLISRLLIKRGACVEFAENGLEGIQKALNGTHDLVLMDVQMPVLDGYSATQRLRDAGFDKPIIALTAHAMSEVREKCMGVGCTDYLPKPVNPKDLVRTIAKYVTH